MAWTPFGEKNILMFVYVAKSSSPSLGTSIKQVKLKHNNVFMNKFMSMTLDLSIYNIIYLYVYMYKIYLYRLEIGLSNFVNKFIRYQIIICNILIL